MSDTLVYSAWSKDVDPLFATDKTMLYPSPTDIYSDRRMSDSTTSESNSPATESDLSLDPVRKPSLPGLDQLLEPVDPFNRRPSMISDMSLSNRRTHILSSYSFPATATGIDLTGGGATATHSPQFSTIPWNSPALSDIHHSVSPPTSSHGHSPKRRPSPVLSNSASPRQQQQVTATSTAPSSAVSHQSQQPEPQAVRRPRGKLPKHTTDLLKEWLHAHSDHPYPSEDEKRDLCNRTKLSMSQVSNWMINARRRILAPAKPHAITSATSDAYRAPIPRQIGSMYPSHMYAPHQHPPQHPHHPHHPSSTLRRAPPPPQDALRLYDPPYYDSAPRYQAQSHSIYPQDRRLSYPSPVQYASPISDFQPPYSQFNPSRDQSPRYFTAPTDSL